MKKKDIGKLYEEQFQSFEAPVSSQEWLAVKAGLGKTKLLALHLTHFKIYYVAAAVVVGTSGVATGIYKYYNSNSEKPSNPIQNEILVQPFVKEKRDSIIQVMENRNDQKKVEKPNKDTNNNNKSQNIPAIDTVSKTTEQNVPVRNEDSQSSKQDTSVIVPKALPKRVIYVNKTDTIIVRDTLKEPPKKKRKK